MLESRFQANTLKEIRRMFPGCMILKNDSSYLQGVPDILILFEENWAMLEFKKSPDAACQPNQEYYVDILDRMSFSAFIYPENKRQVLNARQQTFGARR